jgi:mitochondrial import receptor subunit TOM40
LSPAGVINIGYFHQKTNSPLQLGVEFESSLAVKETSATFSYQYDLAKANTTFRGIVFLSYRLNLVKFSFLGMVDTNGLVTAVIEKRLAPLPFTFMLSSSLNHAKAAYRFGIGLLIG